MEMMTEKKSAPIENRNTLPRESSSAVIGVSSKHEQVY